MNIAHSSGPFSSFNHDPPAINHPGTVAFSAGLNQRGAGISMDSNPLTDKAIGIGDMRFGSKVQQLGWCREGLNNSSQIAFFAILADGTAVFSEPIPTPLLHWFANPHIVKHQRKKQINLASQKKQNRPGKFTH